jgi:hypothetical protein
MYKELRAKNEEPGTRNQPAAKKQLNKKIKKANNWQTGKKMI